MTRVARLSRRPTRSLRLLGAGLLVAVTAGPVAVPASASAAGGRCAPGTGVTVVVDYRPIGGGVDIGCDPNGADKSGPAAVEAAGFDLDYVRSMAGFVCAIEQTPDPAASCGRTSPANAYWGLFSSAGSPSWTYATTGIGGLDVPEGGSIGWRFQNGGARDTPGAAPTGKPSSEPKPEPKPEPEPEPKPEPKPKPKPEPKPEPTSTPSDSPSATPSPSTSSEDGGNGSNRADGGNGAAPATAERRAESRVKQDKVNGAAERDAKSGQADDRTAERDRDASTDLSDQEGDGDGDGEDDLVTSADEPLAAEPVSADVDELTASDRILLGVGGLAIAVLAGSAVVMGRRRRS